MLKPSALLLLHSGWLCVLGVFQVSVRIWVLFFSISVKNITRILMWDLMNLYVTFGNIAILILLIYADP